METMVSIGLWAHRSGHEGGLIGLNCLAVERLQGFNFEGRARQVLHEFSDAQCADLAGNSFAAPAVNFALLALFAICSEYIPENDKELATLRKKAQEAQCVFNV